MTVNTTRVQGRRVLRFNSVSEIVSDAEQVTSGECVVLGNWTAGQIFMHLARSIDASLDGFAGTTPWPVRALARVIKRRFLTRPMRSGFRLKGKFARTLVPGATETQAGLKGLREAIARLATTDQRAPHPAFGQLTREEWDQLHMRHAELHLSFIVPSSEATAADGLSAGTR